MISLSRGPASIRDSSDSVSARIVGPAGSTILLVDDDPAVREGLRRVLQSEGWEIISVAGGEEALEYLQAHRPDLMITDLSMAAVSGWDLLFHENLRRPDLPIFVITALPLGTTGGADRFAHEFFQKPVDIEALIAAVRRYLGVPRGTGVLLAGETGRSEQTNRRQAGSCRAGSLY